MIKRSDEGGLSKSTNILLIVVIVLISLAIIFLVVKAIKNNQPEENPLEEFNANLKISDVQVFNYTDIAVKVDRNTSEENIEAVSFIFYDINGDEIATRRVSIEKLEEVDSQIAFYFTNTSKIDKISVAPIFKSESGSEIQGKVEDEYKVPAKEYPEEELPSCTTNSQCEDHNACTINTCIEGKCSYSLIANCVPCESSNQCNDSNECTTNKCSDGKCTYLAIPGCTPCYSALQCEDNKPCTENICFSGRCLYNSITNCTSNNTFQCTSVSQCNDNNICTNDSCSNNICSHTAISDCKSCTLVPQCEDNDSCTSDSCSNNKCVYSSITSCTNNDKCCPTRCNLINDNNCPAKCGNNLIEGTEKCDGTTLGGATCSGVLGIAGYTRTLKCSNCMFNTSLCVAPCTQTCASLGYTCEYHTICGSNINCGACTTGTCNSAGQCVTSSPNWQTGMVSWWKFNGNALDSVGTNNGANNGATFQSTGCVSGQCASFDGVNDYLSVPSSQFLQLIGKPYTFSAWVNDNTPVATLDATYHRIISFANGAVNIQLGLASRGGTPNNRIFYIQESTSGTVRQVTSGDASNGWHHVVATSNGVGTWSIYLDGILSNGGTTISSSSSVYTTNTGNLYIGQRGNGAFVQGSLDELMIWNRTLDAAEIQTLFKSYNYTSPPCTAETNTAFCARLNKNCGSVTANDNCGTSRTVSSCGTCSGTQTCNSNGQCVNPPSGTCTNRIRDGTETGIDCGGNCDACATGNTYYVATNGNDNNLGTFEQPWATWNYAMHHAHAGDIVYFRGGVYPASETDGYGIQVDPRYPDRWGYEGTAGNYISYFNYPGEVPILDCSNVVPEDYNIGITFTRAHYIHFKGLTVRNVLQSSVETIVNGWRLIDCDNIITENCILHDIAGAGFCPYTLYDVVGPNRYYYINCDAYNNCDALNDDPAGPGQYGDGFSPTNNYNDLFEVYFYGCRAWNTSDQGFDGRERGYVKWDHCWSFNNSGYGMGWGNGFKTSAADVQMPTPPIQREVVNCIAANNVGIGFFTNDNNRNASRTVWYNNFAYHNGYGGKNYEPFMGSGFVTGNSTTDGLIRILKNNVAYANEIYDAYWINPNTHDHNSWDSSPAVTVTAADFVSLDYTQLYAPRKADGSLPDITFGHLKAGSDLIDKGVIIPGLNYSGSAPDLGAFEYP